MKILVLNCGSSSIKYKLFDMTSGNVMAQGGIEKIGLPGSFLKLTDKNGEKVILEKEIPEHQEGIQFILHVLTDEKYGCIKDFKEIDAVGHRVVHGGEDFMSSCLINDAVVAKIEACCDIAPLHNPANLLGIRAVTSVLPSVPQVAVFDTAFHQTMPAYAYMYSIPYEYYEKYRIRRYGFHGTSHRYVSEKGANFVGLDPTNCKVITCHLGNGSSIAAVFNGQSVDTSMGFTPLEGVTMGTRSGSLDPDVVTYIQEKEHLSPEEISRILNKKSGFLGVSGISSDARDLDAAANAGEPRAKLALKKLTYEVTKYIGAYAAAMNGVDLIVFTGGIGENNSRLRRRVCENLTYMGVKFDYEANVATGKDTLISLPDSKVKVAVITTDEELVIARDTMHIVQGRE